MTKDNVVVLALDQALKVSGYSVFCGDHLLDWGAFSINESLPIEQRLACFSDYLTELYQEHCFNHVAFEGVQYQNNAETFKKLAYVQATIYLWCHRNGIKCFVIPPSVWRCELGGDFGRTRKEQKQNAIQYVKEHYGPDVSSDEADAICIGAACMKMIDREETAW